MNKKDILYGALSLAVFSFIAAVGAFSSPTHADTAPTPSLVIGPASAVIGVGGHMTLSPLYESDSSSPTVQITVSASSVSWSSNNPGVASVDAGGRISALQNGLASISGTYGGVTQSVAVQVSGAESVQSFNYSSSSHSYIIFTPSSYTNSSEDPVVLIFHAENQNAESAEFITQMNAVAEAKGFIAVYPEDINDVGTISELIRTLPSQYSINLRKVYATGFSGGALFVQKLGMELSNKIAAIAPVDGSITNELLSSDSAKPIPVVAFHGTTDAIDPYLGGSLSGSLSGSGTALSVDNSMKKWAAANGCSTVGGSTALANPSNDNTTVDLVSYPGCTSGKSVLLYRINNGGHTWPGGYKTSGGKDLVTYNINAGQVMWDFFKSYSIGAPSVSLSANPTAILQGQTSTLSWNAANSASCSIDQGVGSVSTTGIQPVSPNSSTTYIITCNNDVGSAQSSTTVTVGSPTSTDIIGQKFNGWVWSENVGWIHWNAPQGNPGVYGVTILPDGTLAGFAWSEFIGWINFRPSSPYPASPDASVSIDANTDALHGWARADVGIGNPSWDGWIKFDTGGNYGTGATVDNCQLNGWAWGGDVIGWIHLSGPTPYNVTLACGTVSAPAIDVNAQNVVCATSPSPVISWTYAGPNGLIQTAYQIQVSTHSDFSVLSLDTGKVVSTSNSYIASNSLQFNTHYYYRIRGWSNNDFIGSAYVSGSFTTPASRGPVPNFSWISSMPQKQVIATITDKSTASSGTVISSRVWTLPQDATTSSMTAPVIQATFNQLSNPVTLAVTDSQGLTCSVTKEITGLPSVPEFKEIKPQ